jgi:hypothetical protein
MRACFLGQNVCALGFGVAIVQSPPLEQPWERLYELSETQPLEADSAGTPPHAENPMQNRMVRELRRRIVPLS